jgi:hypothetical protein
MAGRINSTAALPPGRLPADLNDTIELHSNVEDIK